MAVAERGMEGRPMVRSSYAMRRGDSRSSVREAAAAGSAAAAGKDSSAKVWQTVPRAPSRVPTRRSWPVALWPSSPHFRKLSVWQGTPAISESTPARDDDRNHHGEHHLERRE